MKDVFYGILLISFGYAFVFLVGMLGKMIWGL